MNARARPILFSAPMVRAILAGAKTQTRRAWRVQPPPGVRIGWVPGQSTTPYGQPGDRLWVRETWQAELRWDWTAPRDIAQGSPIYFEFGDEAVPACAGKRRPSIHMPRWASRITLEITDVRVERLQDISERDALAEGAPGYEEGIDAPPFDEECEWSYYASFSRLWESINGPGSWDANPWVWVVEFKRVEA